MSNSWWVFFFFSPWVYGGEAIASREKKLEEHKFSHMAARRLPPPAPASSPGNFFLLPPQLYLSSVGLLPMRMDAELFMATHDVLLLQ